MDAIIQHVALVSESKLVTTGDLMRVAAALQKQASRDLGAELEYLGDRRRV